MTIFHFLSERENFFLVLCAKREIFRSFVRIPASLRKAPIHLIPRQSLHSISVRVIERCTFHLLSSLYFIATLPKIAWMHFLAVHLISNIRKFFHEFSLVSAERSKSFSTCLTVERGNYQKSSFPTVESFFPFESKVSTKWNFYFRFTYQETYLLTFQKSFRSMIPTADI